MKKQNKIMVIISQDERIRRQMLQRLAVKLGFAITAGDANKIIKQSPFDYDLTTAYFILAETHDFRKHPQTTQRLYEMAVQGIAVVVGVKKLPPEYEFICEIYTENNI
ncbi:hypothetical protein D0T49_01980 [Paludibacter sp. 221]|uniref:hypothetical protein n=1 Tax=Paludibacter sp. 221 TaxID=2302939 RepID=UPI0013D4D5AE|nr:hypothetical protein [Paludibacter sp. 221]NDV45819.1 hypothetical protein [Paludibacter sp. 221]